MSAERLKGLLRQRPFHALLEQLNEERNSPHSVQKHYNNFEVIAHEGVDKLGVTPHGLPPGHLKVIAVSQGSWAEHAGVQVGDTIIEVNGDDLVVMPAEAFKQRLQVRPLKLLLRHQEAFAAESDSRIDDASSPE
eukprot:2841001-Amphidinium_carterae.1